MASGRGALSAAGLNKDEGRPEIAENNDTTHVNTLLTSPPMLAVRRALPHARRHVLWAAPPLRRRRPLRRQPPAAAQRPRVPRRHPPRPRPTHHILAVRGPSHPLRRPPRPPPRPNMGARPHRPPLPLSSFPICPGDSYQPHASHRQAGQGTQRGQVGRGVVVWSSRHPHGGRGPDVRQGAQFHDVLLALLLNLSSSRNGLRRVPICSLLFSARGWARSTLMEHPTPSLTLVPSSSASSSGPSMTYSSSLISPQ